MKPPTPMLDALLREADALLNWWNQGPWWHAVVFVAAVYVPIYVVLFAVLPKGKPRA